MDLRPVPVLVATRSALVAASSVVGMAPSSSLVVGSTTLRVNDIERRATGLISINVARPKRRDYDA
jgi:hypothetical protein